LTSISFFDRKQKEIELKLLEEETAKRIEEAIRKKVEESLSSEEVKLEIQRRIEEGRKKLFDEVAAQLEREKETALIEAREKAVCIVSSILVFWVLISYTRHCN
jgi:arginine and glutamate-rich protein 1